MNVIIKTAIVVILCIPLLVCVPVHAGGKKKMEPLYDISGVKKLDMQVFSDAEVFSSKTMMNVPLFEVPFDNSVGTNNYINGITVLSFPKGKVKLDHYFKREVDDMQGSGKYLPLLSEHEVGFAQDRVFYLCNFKTKKCHEYRVVFSIDETIENLATSDARKKWFIFEVEEQNRHSEDHRDISFVLQLVDLSDKTSKLVKEKSIGRGAIWTVAFGRVFLWHFNKKTIEVFDMNLEPAQHPLGDMIRKNKDKLGWFNRIYPNPLLPFAVLAGGENGAQIICWGDGRDKNLKRLFRAAFHFSYSPDGKWVTFQQGGVMDKKKTYLMPVSIKYPNYLGTPIVISEDSFQEGNCAWTVNPINFVGYGMKGIYRIELTKEAQKSIMENDFDKYPTFHDWIVAKDLEKLTKEKKQGLGK